MFVSKNVHKPGSADRHFCQGIGGYDDYRLRLRLTQEVKYANQHKTF
jgi:hypothetical protein